MKNIILTIILLLIAGGALLYLYRAKKRGENCVGCPYSRQCGSNSCNCGSDKKEQSRQ